jgi:hypothetical protein
MLQRAPATSGNSTRGRARSVALTQHMRPHDTLVAPRTVIVSAGGADRIVYIINSVNADQWMINLVLAN